MLILSLIWLLGGVLLALLVRGAALAPRGAGWRIWHSAVVGALSALAGGWLGALLLGSPFASPTAVWVCALVCVLAPWLRVWFRGAAARPARQPGQADTGGARDERPVAGR